MTKTAIRLSRVCLKVPVLHWCACAADMHCTHAHVLSFTSDCLWCKLHVCEWLFLEWRRPILNKKHEALTVPHADLMLSQIRKRPTLIHHRVKSHVYLIVSFCSTNFDFEIISQQPSNWYIRPGRNISLCITHPVIGRCSSHCISRCSGKYTC